MELEYVWTQVVDLGSKDKRHQTPPNQVANDLKDDEITTILTIIDFFGADQRDLQQVKFDLKTVRYRVFDWLGMCIMGRIDCEPAVKVLTYSFLKCDGDVDAFIADLRATDYDVVRDWEKVQLT